MSLGDDPWKKSNVQKENPQGRKDQGGESLPLIQTGCCCSKPRGGCKPAGAAKRFETKHLALESWRSGHLPQHPPSTPTRRTRACVYRIISVCQHHIEHLCALMISTNLSSPRWSHSDPHSTDGPIGAQNLPILLLSGRPRVWNQLLLLLRPYPAPSCPCIPWQSEGRGVPDPIIESSTSKVTMGKRLLMDIVFLIEELLNFGKRHLRMHK